MKKLNFAFSIQMFKKLLHGSATIFWGAVGIGAGYVCYENYQHKKAMSRLIKWSDSEENFIGPVAIENGHKYLMQHNMFISPNYKSVVYIRPEGIDINDSICQKKLFKDGNTRCCSIYSQTQIWYGEWDQDGNTVKMETRDIYVPAKPSRQPRGEIFF